MVETTIFKKSSRRADAGADRPASASALAEAGQPSVTPPFGDAAALPPLLSYRLTWKVVGWWILGYGLASWLVEYGFSQFDPAGALPFLFALNRVVYAVVWGGAILVAIMATDRLPVTDPRQIGRIAAHLVICFVSTVVWGVLAYYICLSVVPGWRPEGVGKMLASTSKNVLFGYGLVVVLLHIILRVRLHRSQELVLLQKAHQAAEAQLHVLKLEMQPHFLFNALQAVSAQIHSNPNAATDTLVLVSDMLRYAVETTRVQQVRLREELATLRHYTQIQQVRFGDRLQFNWEIDERVLDAAVPHLLLQPLVENAFKHGLERHSSAGRVIVSGSRAGDELCLRVWNDGPDDPEKSRRPGTGIGLANVRTRLAQLYGEKHSVELTHTPGEGTAVLVRLPFILSAHADEDADTIRRLGRSMREREGTGTHS